MGDSVMENVAIHIILGALMMACPDNYDEQAYQFITADFNLKKSKFFSEETLKAFRDKINAETGNVDQLNEIQTSYYVQRDVYLPFMQELAKDYLKLVGEEKI